MFDEPHIYLYPYSNDELELIKGWDGLIDQEGNFYKVCERGTLDSCHDIFAETFVSVKLNKDIYKVYETFKIAMPTFSYLKLSAKDILINLFGFVNYELTSKGLEITHPNPMYNNSKVSDKQIITISKLMRINNDTISPINYGHVESANFYESYSHIK